MDSEECAPGPPLQHQNQQQHPHQNPGGGGGGRSRKRGGGMEVIPSSLEAVVAPHLHHDKVLRSHTRRGRVVGGLVAPVAPTVISSTLTCSRRRQRSSCCSSHTDEDDGGGSGSGTVAYEGNSCEEEIGRLGGGGGGEGSTTSNNNNNNNNNNKGLGEALLIPCVAATSSCFAPTNETKELCEQAGLLGGTTKTTTIHSGGTRLSSSCIPQHNELTTQQCQSNNAGEHSSTTTTSDNVAGANSSQKKFNVVIMDNNSAPCSNSRTRSRQHGNHNHHHRSTPPAADAGDDDNVVQRRNESGDDNDDDEMCQEDAESSASCELPGKPSTAISTSSFSNAASSSSSKAHHSVSSSVVVGTIAPAQTATTAQATTALVKSEFSVCGKGVEESYGNRRACRKGKEESVSCGESVTVKREIEASRGGTGGTCDLTGVAASGGKNGSKIDGGQDGKWSGGGGEFARQDGEKGGGERRKHSNPSSVFNSCGDGGGGASMPQDSGLNFGSDGEKYIAPVVVLSTEEITANKVGGRSVKKCASGGGATSRNKKQSSHSGQTCYSNNNNNSGGQSSKSVGSSVAVVGERKKALVPAPMLLMNNLPYMGELTFDTRPRRGRKPKKADICHLITKNYGIQFPAGVAQAALLPAPIITGSKHSQQFSSSSSSSSHNKKTSVRNETVTVTKNVSTSSSSSSRSLVPPTFCNRDVSIVPIIPTASWGGVSSANSSPLLSLPITTDTKCSPSSSSTANLLKPLSSLAQQLMLHHHHQQLHNPPSPSSSSRSMTSAAMQQTISMFPLPTPSPFSHTQHSLSSSRESERSKLCDDDESEDDNVGDDDEDDNVMEVDIQSARGEEEGDNQDSPLNLCMRDKSIVVSSQSLSLMKEDSLDVRWSRGGGGGGGGGSSKGAMMRSSNSYSSDGAKDSGVGGNTNNKRSMISSGGRTSSSMKGGKSAKLSGSTSQSSSNISVVTNSSSSSGNSDSVSNLVNRRPIPSPFGNVQQQPSKLSPNIFAISAHHLQPHAGIDSATGKVGAGGKGKQSGQNRKKKDMNLRGDVSISAAGSPGSQSASGASSTPLSSFGGTLFGQSTAGINDGAEVSICKFKFTGGAKPCLQEKKMLSVDSGGNFRFYSDKTTGTGASGGGCGSGGTGSGGKLAGKGQQLSHQQFSSSSSNAGGMRMDLCQSPSSADGVETHYALSSLPKSAKSMSMCMPQGAVSNSGIQVQSSSMSTLMSTKSSSASSKMSLPSIQSPTSSSSGVNPYAALSLSPTTEELQQLHLSMQDQRANSSSRVSPYPSGDYSFSSSNSCSSSDNGFGGDGPSSSSTKLGRQATSASSHHYTASGGSSGKMKLKRKRRTRKSLMREKLEKTFKEKGFLIQTQQLESAEGATYCKFRQLRKFTRYLFRSWKDYLPDHVKEISDNNAANGAIPGSDQANPNNPQTGQKGDDSNVQSLADDDGDLDEEDEEEDVEEDDEVDSEEQKRHGLISLENTIKKNTADEEESGLDDEEVFKGSSSRSRRRKQGSKGLSPSSTSTSTGKIVPAPVETKVKVENDLESSSNDVNDMCNEEEEEAELQVDV